MTELIGPYRHPTHAGLIAALAQLEPGPVRDALTAAVDRHHPATWRPQRSFITCAECCSLAWPPPVEPSSMWSDVVYPCATVVDLAGKLGVPVVEDWTEPDNREQTMTEHEHPGPATIVSVPGMAVSKGPFGFLVHDGQQLTLEDAVTQAIGEASACWAQLRSAGTFDSTRAKQVVDRLLAALRSGTLVDHPAAEAAEAADRETQIRELAEVIRPHVRATSGNLYLAGEKAYAKGWRKVAIDQTTPQEDA